MNKENASAEPTKSELEILQVLWEHGPSTVRFINDTLNEKTKSVIYTSTLKIMQIMVEKKLLAKDESQMKHVYTPLVEEKTVKSKILEKFVDAMYNGSASNLLVQLVGNKNTTQEELEAMRELLNKMKKNK